jgi:hypothetical protein
LLLVAWVRFSQPPTNRAGTTFLLFYSGVFFYYALLIALWLLVILLLAGGGHGLNLIGVAVHDSLKDYPQLRVALPVVGALIITVAPRFKFVRKLDAAARSFCIALAAIPREADQLAIELAQGAEFQVTNQKLIENISREITENIGGRAISFENDGTISSRFTRAVALYWLFVMPATGGTSLAFPTNAGNRSAYTRMMQLNDKLIDQANKLYAALIEYGLIYFTSPKPTRPMEEQLKRSIHELSYVVCSLIARYVLFQNVMASQRRRRLSSMGFNARDHQPAFGRDQWVASILTVIVLFSFLSIVVPGQQPFHMAFLYSVLMSLQLGIALIGGTMVAQRFIRRDDGEGTRFPPLAELIAAGLVVVGLCVALRIGWPLVPGLIKTGTFGLAESVDRFAQRWAFVLLPFVCTISIGLLCSYLGTSSWGWMRLAAVGGLLNCVAFVFGGFLLGELLPEELLTSVNPEMDRAKLILMGMIGAAGMALGAIVLTVFPRSIRSAQAIARMAGGRPASLPATLALEEPTSRALAEIGGRANSGASRDLGGYVRSGVEEFEGRYVCFRPTFSNQAVINAYLVVVRWDEKRSCLVFEEQNRPDGVHTQNGLVYVPDGKPFMSLVTMDNGSVRLLTVARPGGGLARGLIMTLSNPQGTHFTPAAAPVVLRRLDDTTPQLGFVHRGAPDYELYMMQLRSVAPYFGMFADTPAISLGTNANAGRDVGAAKPSEADQRVSGARPGAAAACRVGKAKRAHQGVDTARNERARVTNGK